MLQHLLLNEGAGNIFLPPFMQINVPLAMQLLPPPTKKTQTMAYLPTFTLKLKGANDISIGNIDLTQMRLGCTWYLQIFTSWWLKQPTGNIYIYIYVYIYISQIGSSSQGRSKSSTCLKPPPSVFPQTFGWFLFA